MLYDIRVGEITAHRQALLESLRRQREQDPSFTVVDVGGTAGGWTHGIADVIVDINPVGIGRYFKVNLNRYLDWTSVRDYVKTHGKFSFAICSHTLEDIANPMLVLDMLPQIAEEGYVAVPSKYRELSRVEGPWLGYIHHRWIFDVRHDDPSCFVGYPKLGFLEHISYLHSLGNGSDAISELKFHWKESLPYRIVNDDYLGPTGDAVQMYYRALV